MKGLAFLHFFVFLRVFILHFQSDDFSNHAENILLFRAIASFEIKSLDGAVARLSGTYEKRVWD